MSRRSLARLKANVCQPIRFLRRRWRVESCSSISKSTTITNVFTVRWVIKPLGNSRRSISKKRSNFFAENVMATSSQKRNEVQESKRNKWKGPCAVKGRPDPVGGRNLPGKSCSTRKQSEREGLATVHHEASDAKGPARPDQRALRP